MKAAPLFAGIGGHHSARSRTDEWLTPPSLIDAKIRQVLQRGPFERVGRGLWRLA